MFDITRYRLELLDESESALSLGGIQVTNHNLALNPPGSLVADDDVTFDAATGSLRVLPIHDGDPSGTYRHSGLARFGNLPAETRYIRILRGSTAQQVSEGVHFFMGQTPEPEPAAEALQLAAAAAFARRYGRGPRPATGNAITAERLRARDLRPGRVRSAAADASAAAPPRPAG